MKDKQVKGFYKFASFRLDIKKNSPRTVQTTRRLSKFCQNEATVSCPKSAKTRSFSKNKLFNTFRLKKILILSRHRTGTKPSTMVSKSIRHKEAKI